ncbi:MAG: NADP-dependent phosphogluconate dehydrogenase [Candidatus Gracilibacteria bacterium]
MSHLGLIGLGTMGENLVRNIVSKDESIVVWNRTIEKVTALQAELGEAVIVGNTVSELIAKMEAPRNVFLLVPAGKATDEVAQTLFGLLSPGDAIWDLGNAHWDTTIAHQTEAIKHDIHWIGCGISGGSEGARLGPAIMPGGDRETIERMLPILQKIAARDFAGNACVTYVGSAAAGNFVKMVHNGIEYAIMQGIAEIYDILRGAGKNQAAMQDIFREINTGIVSSFLLDITVDILGVKDPVNTSDFLLEKISDIAGSKGTGGWTVEAALKLGVPVPTIAESLFARWNSGRNAVIKKNEKSATFTPFEGRELPDTKTLRETLELTYLAAYIQGLELILVAEKEFQWGINIMEVMRIWQGGCIIRSQMLTIIPQIYEASSGTSEFLHQLQQHIQSIDTVVRASGVPIPVIASSREYLKTLMSEKLPTNLIQAMRDHFGDHTVKRIGSDTAENFEWK